MTELKPWKLALALSVAGALLAGCASIEKAQKYVTDRMRATQKQRTDMLTKEGEQTTIEELGQLTQGFADRYMTAIVGACDMIEKDNPSAQQRRAAHQVKLTQVTSIYDIVTNADAFTQLLDLTLVVTLQSMKWIDENQAEEWFGDRAQYLIDASRKSREDIWKIAAKVMKPEQMETLDYLIWDWRRRNADVEMVSFVRFDDFAGSRGKSAVADVKTGTGLLAPVDEAKKAVDEVRLLGERAFYLGKRMPFLVNWQVQNAMDNALADPQIANITNSVTSVGASVDRVTQAVDRLPADIAKERAAIFDAIEAKEPLLNNMFGQYRLALADTNKLAGSMLNVANSADQLLHTLHETTLTLNGTIGAVDKVFLQPGKDKPKPANEKPFEIESYTQSAIALTNALREANNLIMTTGELLASPKLQKPIQQISSVTTQQIDHVSNRSSRILDQAFWRGVALIVVFFVMLTIYRYVAPRITRLGERDR